MPDEHERRHALRRLRGDMSLRAFAEHLVANGLAAGKLSRHRLGDVERGAAELPTALWDELAQALFAGGHPAVDVAALWSTVPVEPLPPSTPRQRLEQWARVIGQVRDNRWWRSPLSAVVRATSPENLPRYETMLASHDRERIRFLRGLRARLETGVATAGQWQASSADGVAIDRARSTLSATVNRGELFLLPLRLHNRGSVPWRDRLLYRVGAPVTTATPFTPGVLLVPDTDPGQSCDLLIPGRAQWFLSRAAINLVMVFADFTPCLPGHTCVWIDTRGTDVDHSLPLPPGFPAPPDNKGTGE